MDKVPMRFCCRISQTRPACPPQLAIHNFRFARRIHASSIRAAKHPKPVRKPQKQQLQPKQQQPLDYRKPTPHPVQQPSRPDRAAHAQRIRRWGGTAAATAVFFCAAYISYHGYLATLPDVDGYAIHTADYNLQADVSSRYGTIAPTFDDEVSSAEWSMGIQSLRRKMISQAKGDVLEVSIGTGRNLEYYDWNFRGFNGVGKVNREGLIKKGKVRSLTAVDISVEMLEIAHEKFAKIFPGILGIRWIVADASEAGKIPGPPKNGDERSGNLDKKYDTVIQTFGLCSANDPVGLLRNLGECVEENEGRILLLEHGRGVWDWLNRMLDSSAEKHAQTYGCWWNRDMGRIVKESGLEVVSIQRPKWWHGGTTWWIELKRPKGGLPKVEVVTEPPQSVNPQASPWQVKTPPVGEASSKKAWWWPWS